MVCFTKIIHTLSCGIFTPDQGLLPKKKLMSHDLAYTLSKPTSSAESDNLSGNIEEISGETTGEDTVDELWTDYVTNQGEEDSIKWRNPASKGEIISG